MIIKETTKAPWLAKTTERELPSRSKAVAV